MTRLLLALALPLAACASWEGAAPEPEPVAFSPVEEEVAGPLPEVCDNGLDDDLDTLADCADPECAGLDACVVQDERRVVRFGGLLWATYVAAGDVVYEDSGGLDGALLVRHESLRDGSWRVDCQTRIEVAGAPVADEADVAFALAPVLPPEHDGCHLGAELPELPSILELEREGGIVARYGDGPTPWTVDAGQIDWSGWVGGDDFHVDSQGALLELAPPG